MLATLVAGMSLLGIWQATRSRPSNASAEARSASQATVSAATVSAARAVSKVEVPKLNVPALGAPPAIGIEPPLPDVDPTSLPTSVLEQAGLAEEEAYWSHPRFQRIAHLRGAPATSPTGTADPLERFALWESRFLNDYFAQLDAGMAGPGGDVDLSERCWRGSWANTPRRAAFVRHLKAAAMQANNRATVHLPEGSEQLVGYISQMETRLPPPTRSFLEFMDGK